MTPTDQITIELLAKGFVFAEPQQRFTVYIRMKDMTVVGLETFQDGGCLLWQLLTPSDEVSAMACVIPSYRQFKEKEKDEFFDSQLCFTFPLVQSNIYEQE
jgi:hypothetical protein